MYLSNLKQGLGAYDSFHLQEYASFFFFLIYLFFSLHWVFVSAHGLSLVVASRGCSSLRNTDCRHASFSSCGTQAWQLWLVGPRAQAQQSWRTGLVAPWHMGSSRTRAQTHAPCIGRQILNHCATREVLCQHFMKMYLQSCALQQ